MTSNRHHLDTLLDRLRRLHPKSIDLSLDRIGRLLTTLDNPHHRLPPIVHVAGTNGKGSVLAFTRAILEAAGWTVHVYTSPHLVRFNERIRLAGQPIHDDKLIDILERCETINQAHPITFFEIITAAAFLIFSETPADATLIETGLGGRFDATNVIEHTAVTAITRISFDHMHFLGTTLTQIAYEKAGILRYGVPVVLTPQPVTEVKDVLSDHAWSVHAPIEKWQVTPMEHGFSYQSDRRSIHLPRPGLVGQHQITNAAAAIACSDVLSVGKITDHAIRLGLEKVEWPARLQRLLTGPLVASMPAECELWLDGGHNDSAGEVLAHQAQAWNSMPDARPLHLIVAMQANKDVAAFLRPLVAWVTSLGAVPLPHSDKGMSPEVIRTTAQTLGLAAALIQPNVEASLATLVSHRPCRILICGSLYLAGDILRHNH